MKDKIGLTGKEFCNRLYELRKRAGMSQEQLAEKLNVSRQTLSKWELGESTPDMEKLIMISDLFEISLDELMVGKAPAPSASERGEKITAVIEEKVLTDGNKQKAKKTGKILLIILGVAFAVDLISMIVYFSLFGIPK